MENKENHIPVMLDEVLKALSPKDNESFIDCTFGLGGYSRGILNSASCFLNAIDRDENAFKYADKIALEFPTNFKFYHAKFSQLLELNIPKVDGIVFDIGVSSPQLDNSERGFSFMKEGSLNMGMGLNNLYAYDVVNDFKEEDIANIIYEYGEENFSRRIAKAIVNSRKEKRIETTLELANIVKSVVKGNGKIHPATKTFQAIRIYVNDELGELEKALEAAFSLLKKDGRLVVVTFHSLEDRIVKNFFNKKAGKSESVSRYAPVDNQKIIASAYDLRLIKPSDAETKINPRSRSAKLRHLKKI